MSENSTDDHVEKVWNDFWAPIVAPNGVLDLEKVKRELSDFSMVMHEVAIVYDELTGGRISKINTHARHVIAEANARCDERCNWLASDDDLTA
jgi:hypothetical protein